LATIYTVKMFSVESIENSFGQIFDNFSTTFGDFLQTFKPTFWLDLDQLSYFSIIFSIMFNVQWFCLRLLTGVKTSLSLSNSQNLEINKEVQEKKAINCNYLMILNNISFQESSEKEIVYRTKLE
jgi:hypothetical protein